MDTGHMLITAWFTCTFNSVVGTLVLSFLQQWRHNPILGCLGSLMVKGVRH